MIVFPFETAAALGQRSLNGALRPPVRDGEERGGEGTEPARNIERPAGAFALACARPAL